MQIGEGRTGKTITLNAFVKTYFPNAQKAKPKVLAATKAPTSHPTVKALLNSEDGRQRDDVPDQAPPPLPPLLSANATSRVRIPMRTDPAALTVWLTPSLNQPLALDTHTRMRAPPLSKWGA